MADFTNTGYGVTGSPFVFGQAPASASTTSDLYDELANNLEIGTVGRPVYTVDQGIPQGGIQIPIDASQRNIQPFINLANTLGINNPAWLLVVLALAAAVVWFYAKKE